MRYIWLVIVLFFAGCSSKQCGIDEELFKSFSKEQQAKVCAAYLKHQKEIELLRAKRELIAEENRKKALELELKKVHCLYQKRSDPYATTNVLFVRIINGRVGKRSVIPFEFEIARKEARKICLNEENCIWVAYWGANLYLNIWPDYEKSSFGRYVLDQKPFLKKGGVVVSPNDWYRGEYRVVMLKNYKTDIYLKLFIRYR